MLRIVAGEWGGRRIQTPKGQGTRPTSERVREALFNVLGHQLELDSHPVFDLYAGSGALGIEALSRGAPHATFVERDTRTARGIASNLNAPGIPAARWRVVTAKVESWLDPTAFPDRPVLLLLDPPYAAQAVAPLLSQLARSQRPAAGSWIVVETGSGTGLKAPAGLELVQTKRYGDSSVAFFSKSVRDAV